MASSTPTNCKGPRVPKHKTYNVCPWDPAGGVSKQYFHSLRDDFMSVIKIKEIFPWGNDSVVDVLSLAPAIPNLGAKL